MKPNLSMAGLLAATLAAFLLTTPATADDADIVGAVYTMTNSAAGNAVLAFSRDRSGRLTPAGEFATGGLGSGGGLGNQGAVILDPANRWLFVANPASDDVTVFEVMEGGLSVVDRVASNGRQPISLTYSRKLLYVLNAGGNVGDVDNITGFVVGSDGSLAPLAGSTRPLSASATGPAQIQFNSDGDVLVVTEKNTNLIDTYTVDAAGLPSGPTSYASVGMTPFGFAIGKRDQVFVSEAAGGATDQSSVSSYALAASGDLSVVSGAVGTTETAACWVVVSNDGRYVYTTNTGSGSVSGYRVDFDGTLTLLHRHGKTGLTGDGSSPIDMALSNDGNNLYALNVGNGTITAFRVKSNGDLVGSWTLDGLPTTASGLAAR